MHSAEFTKTKGLFKRAIQEQLRETSANYAEKEAALPAYAHRNPLIDMLFWGRLRIADKLFRKTIQSDSKVRILDFGCGTGVMSYYLAQCGHTVTGTDIELGPLEKLKARIEFPATCSFVSAEQLKDVAPHSFDYIFALDVLEHVDSLDTTIETFKHLLKPDGAMIISGPTENILYRIGRKIAGTEFSGEYHVTTIGNIKQHFARVCDTLASHTLYPLVPLFTVFSCRFFPKAPSPQSQQKTPEE